MLGRMKPALLSLIVAVFGALAGCGGGDAKPAKPTPSPESEARASVDGYLKALGRADATAVCEAFSVKSREDIATFGRDKLKSKATCTDALKTLLKGQTGSRLKTLGSAKVLGVKVTGNTGEARVEGLDGPIGILREGGEWRIRSEPTGGSN